MTYIQEQARNRIKQELKFKTLYWPGIKWNIRIFVSERMKEQQ